MDVISIEATPREPGKKGTRAVRDAGNVPCVLYGHGTDPVHFQVPVLTLKPLIYTAETHRVKIKVGRKSWDCILKDIVFDPVKGIPAHVDFLILKAGEKLTLSVPVRVVGTPIGQIEDGGEMQVLVHELQVTCLPKDIPSQFEVDASALRIGDTITVADLPPGPWVIEESPEKAIVSVHAPRLAAIEVEPTEAEEAEAEAEAEATGETEEEG